MVSTNKMTKEIIQKVWLNKHTGQKFITIPKDSGIEPEDWVEVNKISEDHEM